MDDYLLIKAMMLGFAIAAPVGPIGLICIQRTLSFGMTAGIASGLGAASADAIYGAIGAFGLTTLTQLLTSASTALAIFGSLFLSYIGIKLLMATKTEMQIKPASNKEAIKSFVSTFLLTIANPLTILAFIAVFAALSSTMTLEPTSASVMVLGVFLGSMAWWLLLVLGVSLMKGKISPAAMQWLNRIAGMFLLAFAAWQLYPLLSH